MKGMKFCQGPGGRFLGWDLYFRAMRRRRRVEVIIKNLKRGGFSKFLKFEFLRKNDEILGDF